MASNRIADRVHALAEQPVKDLGLKLWDVKYVKEGASWYLRIYIDKENDYVSIDDCTDVSHALDPILDAEDPIESSYYLEVCSPGLNRELRNEEHYKSFIGSKIKIMLYKAENGSKTVTGVLRDYENGPIIETADGPKAYALSAVSKANLLDDDIQ